MNAPFSAPPNCPRRVDGGCGPRRCAVVTCPMHTHEIDARGRTTSKLRVLAARQCDDTCALDIAERARLVAEKTAVMTLEEIAVVLAMDRKNVYRTLVRVQRKIAIATRVEILRRRLTTKPA